MSFEDLDAWIRRRLRCILWRQWKQPRTRAKRLRQLGLDAERVRRCSCNGHGPWWNAGASHMKPGRPEPRSAAHGSGEPSRRAPETRELVVNRRIRNRMSGGVGGRGREAPPYPIRPPSLGARGQEAPAGSARGEKPLA